MNDTKIFNYPKKINFIYNNRDVHLPQDVIAKIDAYWRLLLESGKSYHRGEIYTISRIRADGDKKWSVYLEKSDYAHYLFSVKNDYTGTHICRSVAVSGLIETSDNYIAVSRMNAQTAFANVIQCPGGSLDESDLVEEQFMLEKTIHRELKEEVGIDIDDAAIVAEVINKYVIIRKNNSYLGVCYKIRLNITGNELNSLFEKHLSELKRNNITPELSSLLCIAPTCEAVSRFLTLNQNTIVDYLDILLRTDTGMITASNWEPGTWEVPSN